MHPILKTERPNGDGYIYSMKSVRGFASVKIVVDAEVGGHGCLFGIKMPKFSVEGGCFSGSKKLPEMSEVLHVLNRIFKDYHCQERVVKGQTVEV